MLTMTVCQTLLPEEEMLELSENLPGGAEMTAADLRCQSAQRSAVGHRGVSI